MIKTITEESVFEKILPRDPDSHKGTYGKVLSLCGSRFYRGAAVLSSLGVLRAGAGLLTLCAPEEVVQSTAICLPEATFRPDPSPEELIPLLQTASCILIGCGRIPDPELRGLIQLALQEGTGTLLLDAGALHVLPDSFPERWYNRIILTPHPGEMSAMTGLSAAEILAFPEEAALSFSKKSGAVTLLKQHRTIIAAPDGQLFRNTTGNPGLATGGSGDILAGIIAGLSAQGLSAIDSACCGAWLHGRAADLCAARLSQTAMLPSDILTDLCTIFSKNKR